jgi:hypothetical protein
MWPEDAFFSNQSASAIFSWEVTHKTLRKGFNVTHYCMAALLFSKRKGSFFSLDIQEGESF